MEKEIAKYYYTCGNLASEFKIVDGFENGVAKNYWQNGNRHAIFQKKTNIDHGPYIKLNYAKYRN